jgi:hypothetical protein
MGRQAQRVVQRRQPPGFDVERQVDGARKVRFAVEVMRLPGIHQDSGAVGDRKPLLADVEGGIGAAGFEDHVALRVRMRNQRCIHVEQCQATRICPARS